jgi:beta-fructofuranosidase
MEATVQNDPDLIKAMEAVRAAIPTAEADPARPVYHFHPPANWTNDPNGTIFYKGWHHLFYQLNPFEARIGNQHWGHARSRDLVNWEHLPIAIWPSKDLGERFIYSGCAALAGDGRPRLIYTSIGHPEPEQWMVTPEDDDLIAWKKYPGNPVLAQSAHIGGPISQWRDPFVFQQNGTAYMVCGGGASAGRAQVQLYRAAKADLTAWKHLGPVFQTLDRENRNYECPNLFPLEGKWVMIVSPNRPCEYWVGSLDVERVQFTPQSHGILDPGDSYASNISVDDKGRTILWLWGRTNTPLEKGWASVITMPRILSLSSDGYLLQKPAPEFEALRGDPHTYPAASLETPFIPEGIATDCAEIEAEFTGSGTFGLELRRSQDGQPGIVASIQSGFRGGYLSVGNSRAYLGPLDRYRMRVFLDKCTVEVYVNDGLAAVYQPFTAGVHDLGISVFGQPGRGRGGRAPLPAPRLESLEVWQMRGARFDMEHFHL